MGDNADNFVVRDFLEQEIMERNLDELFRRYNNEESVVVWGRFSDCVCNRANNDLQL